MRDARVFIASIRQFTCQFFGSMVEKMFLKNRYIYKYKQYNIII